MNRQHEQLVGELRGGQTAGDRAAAAARPAGYTYSGGSVAQEVRADYVLAIEREHHIPVTGICIYLLLAMAVVLVVMTSA
jgi:hypothetical protein